MVCDHCKNKEEYQIIIERPGLISSCSFVCNFHKNKITKLLREKGNKFTLNRIEPCSCKCIEGEHYSTSLVEE